VTDVGRFDKCFFDDPRLSSNSLILGHMNNDEADKTEVKFNRKLSDADSRVRQADRTSKMIRIMQHIQGNGRWDAQALAQEFDCAKRTIERYITTLEFAGVPIYYDKSDKCYRLRFDFQFPVLNLSANETLDQSLGLAIGSNREISPGQNNAMLEKIAARSGKETKELINDVMNVVSSFDLKLVDHSQSADQLRTLQWALIEGQQVTGTYQSPYHDVESKLTLHPYRLCFIRSAWYLFARPDDQPATVSPRIYRVVRFKTLKLNDRPSIIPAVFDLQEFHGNAWSVWRGETTYEVEILFTPTSASIVTETKWHHTQRVERHRDGSATVFFTVDGLGEIVWWLLGWAPFARVENPVKLRKMLVVYLNEAAKVNGDLK